MAFTPASRARVGWCKKVAGSDYNTPEELFQGVTIENGKFYSGAHHVIWDAHKTCLKCSLFGLKAVRMKALKEKEANWNKVWNILKYVTHYHSEFSEQFIQDVPAEGRSHALLPVSAWLVLAPHPSLMQLNRFQSLFLWPNIIVGLQWKNLLVYWKLVAFFLQGRVKKKFSLIKDTIDI